MRQMAQELADADAIIDRFGRDRSNLIQILLEIQRRNRWLSADDLTCVSRELDVPLAQIYHVATFYKAFSLVPKGRHSISVCLGTACPCAALRACSTGWSRRSRCDRAGRPRTCASVSTR